jgi:hypothetical protein
MSFRISADKDKPSVAIEIPLTKPLPDYDLVQMEQPTPRDIDSLLVSQGFRDLVDDARGVLMELLERPPVLPSSKAIVDIDLTDLPSFEIAQLTGAICPGDDDVYRPGLWIVLMQRKPTVQQKLGELALERIRGIVADFVKRMALA